MYILVTWNISQQSTNHFFNFDAFQHIQFKLAEMATALITSRLIVRQAAHALDSKSPDASTLCSMAKLSATDQCFEVCLVQNEAFRAFWNRKVQFLNISEDMPISQIIIHIKTISWWIFAPLTEEHWATGVMGVFELKSINVNVLDSENLMWVQRKAHQM